MQEQSNFGTLLKSYRLAAGLSQEALAARARLSARTISDLERGIHDVPRSDTLELLTGALALTDQQRTLLLVSARPQVASFVDRPSHPPTLDFPVPPTRLVGREQERYSFLIVSYICPATLHLVPMEDDESRNRL